MSCQQSSVGCLTQLLSWHCVWVLDACPTWASRTDHEAIRCWYSSLRFDTASVTVIVEQIRAAMLPVETEDWSSKSSMVFDGRFTHMYICVYVYMCVWLTNLLLTMDMAKVGGPLLLVISQILSRACHGLQDMVSLHYGFRFGCRKWRLPKMGVPSNLPFK